MTNSAANLPIYKNPQMPIADRVDDLIARMSPAQKLAQLNCCFLTFMPDERRASVMGQGMGHLALSVSSGESMDVNIALVEAAQRYLVDQTELGIPALVHTEALAGAMLAGATNFPGAIALSATWDAEGVEAMGRVIAKQLVALGVRHVLSPVMDVARDSRWGRIGETYGEDATLSARMSVAFVKGVQGEDLTDGVAATGKHFLGYAMTEGGLNMTAEHIPPRELREVYAKPFEAAIRIAGLAAMMNSYSTFDGVPIVAAPEILTDLLRDELGFGGLTVSDYSAINKLIVPLNIAADYTEAGIQALQAGMDVELPEVAAYGTGLLEAVESGRLPVDYLDRAVRRVLELKFRLGLFEHPYPDREAVAGAFAQAADDELSYQLAHEAITLLENRDNLLPLSTGLRHVAVIGPNADVLRSLFSSYSYPAALEVSSGVGTGPQTVDIDPDAAMEAATQYYRNPTALETRIAALYPASLTVRAAIAAKLPDATITYTQGCTLGGADRAGFAEAVRLAEQAELVILVVGDRDGWHSENCTIGENFDSSKIGLPGVQEDLVQAVVAAGKPTVLVNVSPRPLSSPWISEHVPAVVQAWHLGQTAGKAISDVLFGDYNPGGKLPMSAAHSTGQLPVYYAHQRGSGYEGRAYWPWSAPGYVDSTDRPLYPFGHGLSYTRFTYSGMAVEGTEIQADGSVEISCVVSNTGTRAGDEVVQVYLVDKLASVARPVKELVGFRRITLDAGQSRRVHFTMEVSQIAFLNRQMRWVVEPGDIDVLVGSSSQDIRLRGGFTITGETFEAGKKRAFYAVSRDELLDGYVPPVTAAVSTRFSLDTTISELLANEEARAALERHLPGLFENAALLAMVKSVTLQQIGMIALPAFEPKRIRAVAAELATLGS